MRKPFNGSYPITQAFGGTHMGTDYEMAVGTPLFFCEAGVITYINHNQADTGNGVEYRSNDGVRVWRSLHLKDDPPFFIGQPVNEGQSLGLSGNTGRSDGPHLHQSLKVNGEWSDPELTYGGSSMADSINLDSGRQVYHGILGRNGLAGRPNALDGSSDAELPIGQPLTNQWLSNVFLSPEAKQWRDSQDANSIYELNRRYNAYPELQKTNDTLTQANVVLRKQKSDLETAVGDLNTELKDAEGKLTTCQNSLEDCQNHSWSWGEIWLLILRKFKKG